MQISYFLIKARNKKTKKTTTQFLQHCMWKNDSFTTHDFYIIEIICVHLNALLHFPTADSLFCTF